MLHINIFSAISTFFPTMATSSKPQEYDKELQTLKQAAREAGELVQQFSKQQKQYNLETSLTMVEELEQQCTAKVVQLLKHAFPQEDILSQDTEEDIYDYGQRIWCISSLNGKEPLTYRMGKDIPAVVLAMRQEMMTRAAVLYLPGTDEMYTALANKGVYKQKSETDAPQKLPTSHGEVPLDHAWIELQANTDLEEQSALLRQRMQPLKTRRILRPFTSQMPHASLVAKMIDPSKASLHATIFDLQGATSLQSPAPRFTAWELIAMQMLMEEAGGGIYKMQVKNGSQLQNFDPYEKQPGIITPHPKLALDVLRTSQGMY